MYSLNRNEEHQDKDIICPLPYEAKIKVKKIHKKYLQKYFTAATEKTLKIKQKFSFDEQ